MVGSKFSEKGVLRTIVGYDLRRIKYIDSVFMSSYDEKRRYEELIEENVKYLSPMNLFIKDPALIEAIDLPKDCAIIAFDLPDCFLKNLLSGNVSVPKAVPIRPCCLEWIFIGFDVVDPYTQTSIFDNDSLSVSCKDWVCYRDGFKKTKNGLISDFKQALVLSSRADEFFYEHKPFIPSGVWLKVR